MATLGSLVINISANAAELQKGFTEAKGMAEQFKSALSGLAVPLTAAAGVTALSESIQHGMELAGEFKKMGAGVGGSAGDMFNLQQQVGKSNLEGLTDGLRKVQRELGDAAAGSLEAQHKFEDLGLNWKELSQSPVGEQARAVAQRIKEGATAADQAHVRFELMGKSADGAALAMQKLAAAPTSGGMTGMIIDDRDIQRAADLNSAWQQFKKEQMGSMGAWDTISVKSASYFADTIEGAKRLNDFMVGGKDWMVNQAEVRSADTKALAKSQEIEANVEAQNKLLRAVKETVLEYQHQAEYAGMTADAAKRAASLEAARRQGLSPEQLRDADQQIQDAQELRNRNAANRNLRDQSLTDTNAAISMAEAFENAAKFGVSLDEGLRMAAQDAQRIAMEMKGIDATEIKHFLEAKNELADQTKLFQIGKQFSDPIDDAATRFAELTRLFDQATAEQLPSLERALDAALGGLDKLPELGGISDKLPSAIMQGSKEAAQAANRFEREQQGAASRDPAAIFERFAKLAEDKGIKLSDDTIARIGAALKNNGAVIRKGVIGG